MRIEASVALASLSPTVVIEHLGKTLNFSISSYRRNKFTAGYDVFSQINNYWADQDPNVQQAIFDVYGRIFNTFEDVFDKDKLKADLRAHVIELLSYHDLDRVQEWIAFRAHDIQLPPPTAIPTEYVADVDRNFSMSKTYIVPDYRRLTAYALVLRVMIPVWGEYIYSIKQSTDDSFKEMQAFQLVDTVFNQNVPVIKKLMDYIESSVNSAKLVRPMGVFKGIPMSDYPRWLLAMVTIHCLSIGDIRGTNQDAHLVTYIHMYMNGKLSPKDDLGDSKIKDKEISEELADENQAKASALERYKVKANISIGELVELEHYLSQTLKVAFDLAPDINPNEVLLAIERMKDYEGKPTAPQITLLSNVFSLVVPADIFMYLSEQLLKELMGVSEAVLWHKNQKYLAILSTCHPIVSETEMVVSPVDSKMRIPEPLIEQLDKLFPNGRNQKNKRIPTKDTNLAMESIDNLTNNFMMYGWRPTSDADRVEQVLGYRTKRFPVKPDIKTDLARLTIDNQVHKLNSQAALVQS